MVGASKPEYGLNRTLSKENLDKQDSFAKMKRFELAVPFLRPRDAWASVALST